MHLALEDREVGLDARDVEARRSALTASCPLAHADLVLERVEALALDAPGELGAAGGDDAAVEQHVHGVGGEVVEDSLVVGDEQDAELRAGPRAPRRCRRRRCARASMSRPLSVSSSTARSGSIIAICRISLRFFSPPEKPSLR